MVASLQELKDLFFYENGSGIQMCEVYFKGRFEPFAEISVSDFLGDLLDRRVVDNQDPDIDSYIGPFAFDNSYDHTAPKSEVTRVISLTDTGYDRSVKLFSDILTFLTYLESKRLPFSRDLFDALLIQCGLNVPPCIAQDAASITPGGIMLQSLSDVPVSLKVLTDKEKISKLCFHYTCDYYDEVVAAALHYIVVTGRTVKRCENCGKWFVPRKKADEKYCSRQQNGKTCKEIAAAKIRKERMTADQVQKKINAVRTKLAGRRDRATGETREALSKQYLSFCDDSSLKYREYKKGNISKEEIMEWLSLIK